LNIFNNKIKTDFIIIKTDFIISLKNKPYLKIIITPLNISQNKDIEISYTGYQEQRICQDPGILNIYSPKNT